MYSSNKTAVVVPPLSSSESTMALQVYRIGGASHSHRYPLLALLHSAESYRRHTQTVPLSGPQMQCLLLQPVSVIQVSHRYIRVVK